MPNFDWRQIPDDLPKRYDKTILGYSAWQQLLHMIREYLNAEVPDPFFAAFDEFLLQIGRIAMRPGVCRVFVSHQRDDVRLAESIAYLANQNGFEYWLDVHDPLLSLANKTALPPLVQSILIASIVEMALLNCTHGITVQTARSQQSRWIPYEFGRAKVRWLVSTQVASWFDNGVYAASNTDYVKLGVCALGKKHVVRWLNAEFARCSCATVLPREWDPPPDELPN